MFTGRNCQLGAIKEQTPAVKKQEQKVGQLGQYPWYSHGKGYGASTLFFFYSPCAAPFISSDIKRNEYNGWIDEWKEVLLTDKGGSKAELIRKRDVYLIIGIFVHI